MKIILLLFVLSGITFSSNVFPQKNSEDFSNEDFIQQFKKFTAAFNSGNLSELNEYILPEYGLFILDNPGAYSVANFFRSFDSVMSNPSETDMFRIKNIQLSCTPEYGELPQYNCEEGVKKGWDKTGCYYNKRKGKQTVSRYIYFADENGKYGPDDMDKTDDYQKLYSGLSNSMDNVVYEFYSTNSEIGFYFVVVNDKMFLVMTDLVTPCSA